ncbi:uncharacterized protein LOC142342505 [Convolutriloba macropyga]|uniref:uncharacterized protein LOC142342505 n=1 Tax=Convolutriloba macropyga TaxID=536237 RepID=UPI003F527B77
MRRPDFSTGEISSGSYGARTFHDFLYNPNFNETLKTSNRKVKYGPPKFSLPRSNSSETMPTMHGDTRSTGKPKAGSRLDNPRSASITTDHRSSNQNGGNGQSLGTTTFITQPRKGSGSSVRRSSQNTNPSSTARKVSNDSGIALEKTPRRHSTSINNDDIYNLSYDNSRV